MLWWRPFVNPLIPQSSGTRRESRPNISKERVILCASVSWSILHTTPPSKATKSHFDEEPRAATQCYHNSIGQKWVTWLSFPQNQNRTQFRHRCSKGIRDEYWPLSSAAMPCDVRFQPIQGPNLLPSMLAHGPQVVRHRHRNNHHERGLRYEPPSQTFCVLIHFVCLVSSFGNCPQ